VYYLLEIILLAKAIKAAVLGALITVVGSYVQTEWFHGYKKNYD
jgi:hypothetical protein